jgi:FixJ family two-component response regulator
MRLDDIVRAPDTDDGGSTGGIAGSAEREADAVRNVYVVDDDAGVRRALGRLLRSVGFRCRSFGDIDSLIAGGIDAAGGSVVADVDLGGSDSLGLPGRLSARGIQIPVIFLTAWDSSELRERARRAGGVGCFRKPVDDHALVDAIRWAVSAAGMRTHGNGHRDAC